MTDGTVPVLVLATDRHYPEVIRDEENMKSKKNDKPLIQHPNQVCSHPVLAFPCTGHLATSLRPCQIRTKQICAEFMLRSSSSLFSPFTLASQQDIPPALQAEIRVTRRQSNLPFQETFSTTQYKNSKKNACFNVSVSTTLIFKGLTPFYPSPFKKKDRLVGLKPISEAVRI